MQPTEDSVLLRQYAEDRSDEAFAALVARHINLVYSVALRCVGNPHQAEEVAQAVFVLLAKKAAQLRHARALPSWLFQTTRLTASNFVRSETRRHRRELEAHMQSVLNDPDNDLWPRIAPMLDDAVAGLNEQDRHAIVLRFYEGMNLREVGAAMGASEDAAEKRVSRAVERLRTFFAKRGVTVSASGLAVALSANAVQAAPAGLAVSISAAAAVAGSTVAASTATQATLTTMNWINAKSLAAIAASALVAGTGTYFVQEQQANRLRTEHQTLLTQQTKLAEERDAAVFATQARVNELAALRREQAELLRLRNEVGMLRKQTNDLATLRQANRQLQAALSEAGTVTLKPVAESDLEKRKLMPRLAKVLTLPLLMYANDNRGLFPASFDLAAPYFQETFEADPFLRDNFELLDATQQFEIVYHGSQGAVTNAGSMILIREKQARRRPDGRWERAYGFADGHGETRVETNDNFEAWEKARGTARTSTRPGSVVRQVQETREGK